ncbi:hypothetical protein BDR26DRAFT_857932 [Obelidium mucronatum]|nr:hypothetical protein BDR26DRAFT_857932 [Obelidium mucronatum]
MTAIEEEGWNSLLLPLFSLVLSIQCAILFAFSYKINPHTIHVRRTIKLMLFWASVRCLGFLLRTLASVFPSTLGDSIPFVAATRVLLSIGGAPLSRLL